MVKDERERRWKQKLSALKTVCQQVNVLCVSRLISNSLQLFEVNGTFLGQTEAPMSVKTVAPPACTSLICSRKEETVYHPASEFQNKSGNTERTTDVKQPGGDSVSCPQLFKGIGFIFLKAHNTQNTLSL